MDYILQVDQIDSYYGNMQVLRSVSLNILERRIVALLEGNGAGKTTTMRTFSGVIKPRAGNILFSGESIIGLRPD